MSKVKTNKKKEILLFFLFIPVIIYASPPTPWLHTAVMLESLSFCFPFDYWELSDYRDNPESFATSKIGPIDVSTFNKTMTAPTQAEFYNHRASYASARLWPNRTYFYGHLTSADSAYVFLHNRSRILRDSLRQGRSLEQMKEDLVARLSEMKKYGEGDLPDFFTVIDKKFKGSVPQFVDWLFKHSFVTNDRLFKRTQRRVVRYRYEYDSAYLLTLSKNRWLKAHGVPSFVPDWKSYDDFYHIKPKTR